MSGKRIGAPVVARCQLLMRPFMWFHSCYGKSVERGVRDPLVWFPSDNLSSFAMPSPGLGAAGFD
jgi:hypothetical protein